MVVYGDKMGGCMSEKHYISYADIQIGQFVEREFVLHRQDILDFSKFIDDRYSFHVKSEAANLLGFPDIIGHGVHLLVFISKTIGEELPGFGTLYLSQEVEFFRPVQSETKLLVRITVLEKGSNRRIKLRTEIFDSLDNPCISGVGVVKAFK